MGFPSTQVTGSILVSPPPPAAASRGEDTRLSSRPLTRPPSYGALCPSTPTPNAAAEEEALLSKPYQNTPRGTSIRHPGIFVDRSTLSNSLDRFATFIFTVEMYKRTLAPASLVGLTTFTSALLCSGYVGGIVDRTPRLKFVRTAVVLQKVGWPCRRCDLEVHHHVNILPRGRVKVDRGDFTFGASAVAVSSWLNNLRLSRRP